MDSNQYGQLVFLALGIYCIYKGIMVLTTGKLTAREETKLRSYSENGIRRYKMVSAVTNIFGGIMICAVSIIRMLNLIDMRVYRIILLVLVAVLLLIYIIGMRSSKNLK